LRFAAWRSKRYRPASLPAAARLGALPGRARRAIEPRFSALIWTAAASGLRFGELSGLEIRHLDVARSELRVDETRSLLQNLASAWFTRQMGHPRRRPGQIEGGELRRSTPRLQLTLVRLSDQDNVDRACCRQLLVGRLRDVGDGVAADDVLGWVVAFDELDPA
jgi:integrase